MDLFVHLFVCFQPKQAEVSPPSPDLYTRSPSVNTRTHMLEGATVSFDNTVFLGSFYVNANLQRSRSESAVAHNWKETNHYD